MISYSVLIRQYLSYLIHRYAILNSTNNCAVFEAYQLTEWIPCGGILYERSEGTNNLQCIHVSRLVQQQSYISPLWMHIKLLSVRLYLQCYS